ncbi:MAG: hypothetical protein E7773_09955 [Sphingomonas sp.]|uniref:hypothetical protein n=1 Tax=Sphingomonas sp. TaxID=28214 RepID=UPI00121F189F|nr:hypothetical protein [Sphingomonas sp.]THD36229.1 MAG: hypothetical protein E7773_09955 [Sphingomonas sp.]
MTPKFWIEVILAASMMLVPLAILVQRMFAKTKEGAHFGMGVRITQLVGVCNLPPALIILGMEGLLDASAMAALGGALVGYLFSGLAEFDRRKSED